MKKLPFLAILFAFYLVPAPAQAEQVRCESLNNQETECPIVHERNVRVVRQISKTRCVENENWGHNRRSIWVDHGCRAIFETDSGYNNAPSTGGNVGSSLPNNVTCESMNNRQVSCDMDTRGEVKLVRQLSSTRCVEGQNWGLTKHTVWVKNGCRAVFQSAGRGPAYDNDPNYGGNNSSNSNEPPTSYIRACNAVEDDYGQVVSSSPLKPGHWEIILQYNKGKYVCNVGPGGKVTYFERLRNQ